MELVRWPIEPLPPGPPTRRERMLKTAPAALTRLNAPVFRLPAGHRIRRIALTQSIQVGFALTERRDYETVVAGMYAEDVVWDLTGMGEHRFPDADERYFGRSGVVAALRIAGAAWAYSPVEAADAGGPLFAARVEHRYHGSQEAEGLEFALDFGHLYYMRDGLVARQETYIGWDTTLETLLAARARQGASVQPPRG
jgi:ketosteroid isomerase-like protein